ATSVCLCTAYSAERPVFRSFPTRRSSDLVLNQMNEAQLLISHPNYSGLQFDQISRTYVPAHFVQEIRVRYGDRTIMTVEGNISLDRKSTRLNSSHVKISYAVFCLKKNITS